MANAAHDDDAITGINVTPLVDITLVLLIIFMVTAKLIAGQGIPLDLPKAASAGATQTTLTIAIAPDGKIMANGEPVLSDAALADQARRALKQNPELRTVVSASAAASHGNVMHVVDTVREAGVVKIAFAADRLEPKSVAQ
ncbi:MAG: biopolymer transporter ExbD [Myxococcota bacterium]|jgi:biopolymer transport protein ExbD|nr:biopolymer transporter ExbD [Myxococcota bacterium]